jgi:hypothetical protein
MPVVNTGASRKSIDALSQTFMVKGVGIDLNLSTYRTYSPKQQPACQSRKPKQLVWQMKCWKILFQTEPEFSPN